MSYEILNVTQGSQAWLDARKECDTASEAPSAKGVGKYMTRDQLLLQKKTGLTKTVDAATQKLFDRGHQTEEMARVIAEKIIGEELYPITAKITIDGLNLLASMDGLTMSGTIGYEHKLISADLVEQIKSGKLDPHYTVQMDQEMLVTGAEKILFMASDGTEDNCFWRWYEANEEKKTDVINTWHQFHKDLEVFVLPETKSMPKAEVVIDLPALFVSAKAEITTSNMKEYGEALSKRLTEVRSIVLVTDQDFSNAKESAKKLRDGMTQAQGALESMTAQNTTFDEAKRMIGSWIEDMRVTALKLEKDVIAEDIKKKSAMIQAAKDAFQKHLEDLREGTNPIFIPNSNPDFAGAIKNKRSYDNMQSAINDLLAQEKVNANQIDMSIRAKQTWMKQFEEHADLFPDLQSIIFKAEDDFKLLVQTRVNAQIAKAEAIKTQAEEAARVKLEQENAAKLLSEQTQESPAESKPASNDESQPANIEPTVSKPSRWAGGGSGGGSNSAISSVKKSNRPTRDDMIAKVAFAYNISRAEAEIWLIDEFQVAKAA